MVNGIYPKMFYKPQKIFYKIINQIFSDFRKNISIKIIVNIKINSFLLSTFLEVDNSYIDCTFINAAYFNIFLKYFKSTIYKYGKKAIMHFN